MHPLNPLMHPFASRVPVRARFTPPLPTSGVGFSRGFPPKDIPVRVDTPYPLLLLLMKVRRSSKRAEAVETASRTGNLRIVLGASAEAEGDDHDSHHSPDSGWLTTDVNVLDVTDPADFE